MTTKFIYNETSLDAENLNSVFIEPPNDGYVYARKNGKWTRHINVDNSNAHGDSIQSITSDPVDTEHNQAHFEGLTE